MQRIIRPGQAEQTINKSRFIAVAEYCDSERAVMAGDVVAGLIEALRSVDES